MIDLLLDAGVVPLSVGFKGERKYHHGTDIFTNISEVFNAHFGSEVWVKELYFKGFLNDGVSITFNKPTGSVKGGATLVTGDGLELGAWILDGSNSVGDRYGYDESLICSRVSINQKSAFLEKTTGFSRIEELVAMTKSLHLYLFDGVQKSWAFSRLEMDVPLSDVKGELSVRLMKNLNGRYTVSEISSYGTVVGKIRFSAV